jgi:hypothetical protein
MANNTDIERLNYYEGEFLGAVDFEAEQEYHREMRRRHNVGQHTWGIVSGLDLVQISNGAKTPGGQTEVDIYVQPGMAVDGFGREVIALSRTQLTQDLFAAYFDPNPAAPPKPMYVWISYAQVMLQPPTDACTVMNQPNAFGRVQETFALTVTPDPTGPTNDLIVVDGKAMSAPVEPSSAPPPPPQPGDVILPYDNSVPYQEFSTDDSSVNWYVKIGRVFWDPHNGVFVQQPDTWPDVGREFAGNVTSAIYASDDTLTISDRFAPSPLPGDPTDPTLGQFYGGVNVEIAGSLTVDRLLEAAQNILIDGSPDPTNATLSPLTIKPSGANEELIQFRDSTGVEKWLVCENPNGTNPGLNFGEVPAGGSAPGATRLFLQVGGNVGIGTLTPVANLDVAAGLLHVGATPSPAVTSPGAYIGWNASGATGETDFINNQGTGPGGFAFMNTPPSGSPRNTLMVITGNANVGIGTATPAANLDVASGLLHVGGNVSPVVTAQGAYIGWNALTGGTGETDFINNQGGGSGGFAFMNSPSSGSPRSTLMVITGAGSVGIGTQTPAAQLDVVGSLKVSGNQNIFGVRTFPKALSNQTTTDTFRSWSISYVGQFEQVYSVFAVFQGFSVFNNENNLAFNSTGHVPGGNFIPQHAFVRVDFFDLNGANGVCYCSESDNSEQADNSIFFTVIVMGKPKF